MTTTASPTTQIASRFTSALVASSGCDSEPLPPPVADFFNTFVSCVQSKNIHFRTYERLRELGRAQILLAIMAGLRDRAEISMDSEAFLSIIWTISMNALLVYIADRLQLAGLLPRKRPDSFWACVFVGWLYQASAHEAVLVWLQDLFADAFDAVWMVSTHDISLLDSATEISALSTSVPPPWPVVAILANLKQRTESAAGPPPFYHMTDVSKDRKPLRPFGRKIAGGNCVKRGRAGPDTSRSQLTLAIRNHIQARDDLKPLTLPEAAWAKCASDGSLQSLGELVLQAVLLELIQDSGYTLSVKRKEVVLASLSSPRTLATILDMCTGSFPAGGLDAQVRAAAFLVYVGGLYTCTSAPDLPRLAFAQLREWLGGVFQPMVRVAVGAPMRHKGTKDVIVISYADLEAAQYEREMEDVMLVDVSNSLVSRVEPPEDFVSRIVKDIGLLCLTDESVTDDVFSL